MAKIYHLSEDLDNRINDKTNDTGLINYMHIETRGSKIKELTKVSRLGSLAESVAEKRDVVCIICDEDILQHMDDDDVNIILDDTFCRIGYDMEKDNIQVNKTPTITMTVDGWRKYGDKLANAYEKAILIRQQLEEQEKMRKEQEKEAKATKRKK